MDASVGTRPRRLYTVGTGLSLAGAALLVAAAFLPESSRVEAPLSDAARAGTLWTDGLGLMMVLAGALVGTITLRSSPRSAAWCWASLWVGLLALGNAIALAATEAFRPIELGIAGLGVAGLALLAGAAAGFACTGPVIPGLGTWRSLPDALGRPLATPAESARRPRLGLVSRGLGALVLYGALSVVLWGLPLASEFRSALIAENSIDPSVYTWFYGWWPHAIVSGLNPFLTDAIFAPDGYNLTWVTAVPGPSVLMAPVTLALGPVATYNLLALAGPPLAAWSAFLLSRHVAGAVGPAIVAGFVFGFSPYMLRMLQGSPHLYFVALVPLAVLLVLKRLDGSIGERPFVVAITLGVAAQFLTSNDVLATMSIFGALALLAAFVFYVERRPALLRTAALIATGYVGAAVLVSPVLFFMLFEEHTTPAQNTPFFANDLVSWFLPDSSMLVAESHAVGGTNPNFGGLAYFGIPLLLLVGVWIWKNRGRRSTRLLAFCFLAPAVAGLGHRLTVNGEITRLGLPWAVVDNFPGLELLVPQRFPLYAFLAASLIVALWLAAGTGWKRWAAVVVIVASTLPWVGGDYWKTDLATPAFFTSGASQRLLDEDDHVLVIPIIGDSMRWQAEADFSFQLAGGGVGAFPESYTDYPIFSTLISGGDLPADYELQLQRFIEAKGVTAVVVDKGSLSPERERLFDSLRVEPVDTGGVLYYRLDPTP